VLGITLQLDRNRFELPSLPDSENLIAAANVAIIKYLMVLNDDVEDSKKEHMLKLDMVIIVC